MTYRVRFSDEARADLIGLLVSLAEHSPQAAALLEARLEAGVSRLEQFPLTCGLSYENDAFAEEIRHLLFGVHPKRKYRALFTVRADEVVILAIRAPGERPVNPRDIRG